ncbi:hypothetical protein SPRG_12935 [Saprolegnia parasitica CBS 223.65]|uniref:HECT-type E3 ubiquitin transferase n=1 Tax=Saprolegnia parasitica (strain CBS 223.65) TaxID=695850 RepID=A0A067BRP0_SAPPC|nr:hypothetical protein SPRG_12935 [Saprolegnia parasitica CBS 223.65]KDO21154.1 hypothetical protein SPRG_12935 [Saprolegnia parasitica CBS 223.65]|eukprot:XP_012208153.1 hypothetical protein SPRG_12935 [Saprolegnia parasitica CBS 223.65]
MTIATTQLTSAVRRRDVSAIAAILTADAKLANGRDESGRTALTTLCANADGDDVCTVADVLLAHGALISCNDGLRDGPLRLASRGTNAALLTKLLEAAKAQEAPTPNYGDLLLVALSALAEASPLQTLMRPITKRKTKEGLPDAKREGGIETLVALEARHLPAIQALIEASERDTRVPPDNLWATTSTHQTTALHVACRELLPTVVLLLLSHSFLPSVVDARNVSAVHCLDDTLLKVVQPRKKPPSLNALPADVQAHLGARTNTILGAFGERVGYEKLFRHSGTYAVQSRWAKNFLVAARGFEFLFAKLLTETPRSMRPFLSHVGGLHRLAKQPASAFATWAWHEALHDQRHLFKDASRYAHLFRLLLHTDTSAAILHTWTFVLQDTVDVSILSPFLQDLTDVVLQSATSLVFQLQTEAYELDETELMRLVLARFEMLLVLGIATNDAAALLAPLEGLQQLLNLVLPAVRHVQDSPERFLGTLYLVQLGLQVRATDSSTLQAMAATHGRKPSRPGSFLKLLAESLPLPASFLPWLTPFRGPLNVLLTSVLVPRPSLLRQYVPRGAWHLVDLETKVAYFGADASLRGTDLRISVNRQTSPGLVVEFILQQVLSTPVRHLWGDMNVEFTHEPGAGVGPLREFFELVRRSFLDPQADLSPHVRVEAPATQRIGSAWLRLARPDAAPRVSPTPLTAWFPLVAYIGGSSLLRLAPRPQRIVSPPEDILGNHVWQVRFESIDAMRKESDLYKLYRCLGRLFGLSVRHGIVLGARFPLVFWHVLLQTSSMSWTDLVADDPVLRRSLDAVLAHDFERTSSLELAFETCDRVEYNGVILTAQVELTPHGFETPVTNANKEEYVLALAMHHFCSNCDALDALRDGLFDVVPKREMALLRPDELQRLLGGDEALDMTALQASTTYGRLGSAEHPTIRHFWAVVEALPLATQRELLVFWSGSSLPPLFGFAHSDEVAWSIDVVAVPAGKPSPLPQAHTCDRRIVLPAYATQDELATKLALALEFGTFGYDRI